MTNNSTIRAHEGKPSRAKAANGHGEPPVLAQRRALSEAVRDDRPKEPPRPKIKLEWFGDIKPSETDWLVHEILPREGVGAIYGPVQSGKSFVALDWAFRLAAGMKVLGAESERVGVAYIAAEGAAGVRKRVTAWRQEHEADPLPFAMIPNRVDLRAATQPDVQALIEELEAARVEFSELGAPLGLIVVDTFASATPGMVENSAEGMSAATAALQAIGDATGAFVLAVHHTGKDTERGLRGHSAFLAALETTIEVVWDDKEPDRFRELHLRKQKDGESNRALTSFAIRAVEIGKTKKGLPLKGAVIDYDEVTPVQSAKPKAARLTDPQRITLQAVQQLLSEGICEQPPRSAQCPPGVKAVQRKEVLARARALGVAGNGCTPDASRNAVNRAREALIAKRCIFERDELIWLAGP